MAAAPRVNPNLFPASDFAKDEEVEALETSPQEPPPPPEQPTGLSAEEEAQPPKPHQEAIPYERWGPLLEQNKKYEQELAELRDFRTRQDERSRLIRESTEQAQRQAQAQAEAQRRAAERPDPGLDPIGAELYDTRYALNQQQQVIEQLRGQLNQFGQHYSDNQEQTNFSNWVTGQANEYTQQDPEYMDAAKYAAARRIDFWKSITPNAPAGLAEKLVEGESMLIARLSQQYGGRFAPAVAKLARDWGFAAQANGNGAQRPQPSPQAQRLQQVQNGQRVQGLSVVPNGGNPAEGGSKYRNFTPVDIAQMSEKEFMSAMANPNTARDLRYAMAKADGFENGEANY